MRVKGRLEMEERRTDAESKLSEVWREKGTG